MPLPLILGTAAAIAGTTGVGTAIHGLAKMKEANDTMSTAKRSHELNVRRFETANAEANGTMDELGKLELSILHDFDAFSDLMEQIQNRPEFKSYSKDGVGLPQYNREKLKEVAVGAGVLLGGLGGAAVGTAGGFAAAGATTAAVMALGTASTGTAIATLSGAALTNATLAALGGGAIAAGGGGIALGTTILSATTLGAGLLVGGIIFNFTGETLSNKANEAFAQMKKAEREIDKICPYLRELTDVAKSYSDALSTVKKKYEEVFSYLSYVVYEQGKTNWHEFSEWQKQAVQNGVLLVGLLYKMCQVQLVRQTGGENNMNQLNKADIRCAIEDFRQVMRELSAA